MPAYGGKKYKKIRTDSAVLFVRMAYLNVNRRVDVRRLEARVFGAAGNFGFSASDDAVDADAFRGAVREEVVT